MRIYEDKDKKAEIQCGYCYNHGHNKRYCPTMKAQWDANPQVHETYDHDTLVGIDKTMFSQYYQTYWGDDQAKVQFRSHWQYMKKRFAPKASATTKKRKKPKCGFCGSTSHNRRNCKKMKNFVYVLQECNKQYRSDFYDHFIEEMGYGAGALVQYSRWSHKAKDWETNVGIVEKFPVENVMFTNLTNYWSDYFTKFEPTILVNGRRLTTGSDGIVYTEKQFPKELEESYGKMGGMHSQYCPVHKIMSPAPNKPTKEWFLGQEPCFDFVVRKRNLQGILGSLAYLIKKFYPHDNLRTKLGAKIYDQYYC